MNPSTLQALTYLYNGSLSEFLVDKGFSGGLLDTEWMNLPTAEKLKIRQEWQNKR